MTAAGNLQALDEPFDVTYIHAGKYKIEGNADAPLDKESRAEMQRHVDRYYRMFVESVARNRATTVDRVESARGGSWACRMPFGARWLTE